MAQINLLPWREARRAERKRQFVSSMAGAVILMLCVVGYVHFHIQGMISYQNSRNTYLEREIQKVEAKIKEIRDLESKKAQLISRMRVIERLQRNRPEVVHVFQEVATLIPEGIYLKSIKQNNNVLTINGIAQSNARVSSFMRALENSDWFDQPRLEIIKTNDSGKSGRTREFSLQVNQSSPEETEADKG